MESTASPPHRATPPSSYWERSASPLASLFLVLPLLLAYEGGVMLLGRTAMRNGVELWLRGGLEQLGFGQYLLLPAATCGLLLAWQHASRHAWSVSPQLLLGMLAEAALLAGLLFAGALLLARGLPAEQEFLQPRGYRAAGGGFAAAAPPAATPGGARQRPTLAVKVVAYCGAGLYEELLFRLMLLPALALLLHQAWGHWHGSLLAAAVISSLLFALAHHLPGGEPWIWQRALFRWSAGMVFAALFLLRGYGVAAASHAGYDVLVALAEG